MQNYENTTFPVVVTCDLLEYGGKPFMVSCYHDLTEQISQIKVEQTAQVKSQFLTNMSHELRTPLHGITGGIDLLLNTELNTKQRETAELIRTSGQRLLSIVNDILSFSYLEKENPELQISEFDLPELIKEVMKISTVQICHQNLELSCLFTTDIPQRIDGDINKLRQVLMALLNNGLKFTQKGNVKLTVAFESWQKTKENEKNNEENDKCVLRFTVSDTGIGIPQNQLNHLFQSFSQLNISFTREYEGIGMGLAISHQLIRLMKGQIGVESQEHVGSTFWFTVPFTCKEKVFSVPSQTFFHHDTKATTINSVVHSDKNTANHSKNNLTAKTNESANLPKLTNVKMGRRGGGGYWGRFGQDFGCGRQSNQPNCYWRNLDASGFSV
jgi:signal transduction histidine kinase